MPTERTPVHDEDNFKAYRVHKAIRLDVVDFHLRSVTSGGDQPMGIFTAGAADEPGEDGTLVFVPETVPEEKVMAILDSHDFEVDTVVPVEFSISIEDVLTKIRAKAYLSEDEIQVALRYLLDLER